MLSGTVQDFKEAARLAAEAKVVTAEAESGMERAQTLRQQAQEAEAEEAACAAALEALADAVEAAAANASAARLKRLLVGHAPHCSAPAWTILCMRNASLRFASFSTHMRVTSPGCGPLGARTCKLELS